MRKDRAAFTILIITAIFLFATGTFLYYATPGLQVKWSKTYLTKGFDDLASAEMTSDGGFVMAGTSTGPTFYFSGEPVSLSDFWVQKVGSNGNVQWSKTYPSTNESSAASIDQTTDGGYIISGITDIPPIETGEISNMSFLLLKVDQYGNEEWNKTYAEGSLPTGSSVQQTTDGGYILTGAEGGLVIKTYSNGSLQWSRAYPAFGGGSNTILETSDGGYILLGWAELSVQGVGVTLSSFLLKIDEAGNQQWNRTFASVEHPDSSLTSIQQTTDGGYILAGTTDRGVTNNNGVVTAAISQAWLLKLYSNGSTQWSRTFNTADPSMGGLARQTSDGGYISAISARWGLGYDVWLWRTDANGTTLWSKPVESDTAVFYLQQTADGDYVLAASNPLVSTVLMKVSGAPPPFSPDVIPVIYAASGGFLVAAVVVAIAVYLKSRKLHKATR